MPPHTCSKPRRLLPRAAVENTVPHAIGWSIILLSIGLTCVLQSTIMFPYLQHVKTAKFAPTQPGAAYLLRKIRFLPHPTVLTAAQNGRPPKNTVLGCHAKSTPSGEHQEHCGRVQLALHEGRRSRPENPRGGGGSAPYHQLQGSVAVRTKTQTIIL